MAFQITGKLELVGEVTTNSNKDGKTFSRRKFVLDCTRYNPDTGDPWENHPEFELSGDKCSLVDQFKVGQRLTVDFVLRGTKYTDKQTGEIKYFTTISAFKIQPAEQQYNQNSSQQQKATQAATSQPAASVAQSPQGEGVAEEPDNLPF